MNIILPLEIAVFLKPMQELKGPLQQGVVKLLGLNGWFVTQKAGKPPSCMSSFKGPLSFLVARVDIF